MKTVKIDNKSLARKLFWGVAAILIIVLIITGCSARKAFDSTQAAYPREGGGVGFADEYNVAPPSQAIAEEAVAGVGYDKSASSSGSKSEGEYGKPDSDSGSLSNLMAQRKIIMEGIVYLETHNFEDSLEALDQLITDVGGFAEAKTVKGKSRHSRALRNAHYVIRVPSEVFEDVMDDMGSIGTVLESNSKGTDITDQYTDYETRLKALRVQEETLLNIMEKSTKLEDVITLESRISEVRYEIESIENSLKNYDRLIAFSRITIDIQEVDDVTETRPVVKTLKERVESSFNQSIKDFIRGCEDFLVWLAGSWITIIFLIIVIIIVVVVIRRKSNKSRKHNKISKTDTSQDKIHTADEKQKTSDSETE